MEHSDLSWIECYNNSCQIYFNNKNNTGWFSKALKRNKQPQLLTLNLKLLDNLLLPSFFLHQFNSETKHQILIEKLGQKWQKVETYAISVEPQNYQHSAAHLDINCSLQSWHNPEYIQ